jgi:hypothetical protein
LFHYVSAGSRLLPHSRHLTLANRLRRLEEEAHDPWPTFYRANTPGKIKRICGKADLVDVKPHIIEPKSSCKCAHAALFCPMMM